MRLSKLYCMLMIASSLIFNITYADTCYDPNYDSYYQCQGDEYIAPVVAGLLFGAIIAGQEGDNNGYYNHGNHGGYHGNGNHGGYHGGGNHGGNNRGGHGNNH